jgi:hypothetical protein
VGQLSTKYRETGHHRLASYVQHSFGRLFLKASRITSMDDVRTPIYAAEPYQEASLVESRNCSIL